MTRPTDDLEAVRSIVQALDGFTPEEQERILRWAREKVGLLTPTIQQVSSGGATPTSSLTTLPIVSPEPPANSIKVFVDQKNPSSDAQFCAVVAYFYRFVAPPQERVDEITAQILTEACRLSQWKRFTNPLGTLNNTVKLGYLDRGNGRGKFRINSVGENLVAMSLPGEETKVRKRSSKKAKSKKAD